MAVTELPGVKHSLYRSVWLAGTALLVLVLVAVGLSLVVGSGGSSFVDTLHAFRGQDEQAWLQLRHYRIPRTLLAILVGAGIGVAGLLVQTVMRNPLAGPGILGVNAGASLTVMVVIGFGVVAPLMLSLWAMAGAALIATIVFTLGTMGGTADPVRVLLIGTAIGASLEAVTAGMALLRPNSREQFRQWAIGSVADRGETMLPIVALALAACLLGALAISRQLDASALGDDTGAGLGVNRVRLLLATGVLVTVLCGTATAAAGPIVFIGLVVPHIARVLVGVATVRLVPICALAGALLLLTADIAGRILVPGIEIPAGAMSAMLGAPLFFMLIRFAKVRL